MTEVFRDGDWQSMSEKEHPQDISAGGIPRFTRLRAVMADGKDKGKLDVVRDGVQSIGYAVRVRPPDGRTTFTAGTRLWFRVQRYPIDPADHGTYWNGPINISFEEGAFYWAPGTFEDHKGGKVGLGYGVDIASSRRARVDFFKLTLRAVGP